MDEDDEEEEAGPDDFLPEVAVVEDESSDEEEYKEEPDEEHDEAYLAWKRQQGGNGNEAEEEGAAGNKSDSADVVEKGDDGKLAQTGGQDNFNFLNATTTSSSQEQVEDDTQISKTTEQEIGSETKTAAMLVDKEKEGGIDEVASPAATAAKSYKRKRKAVVVIASGAQKFEKLSFSLSIPRINMKICLPSEKDNNSVGTNGTDDGKGQQHRASAQPTEKHDHCLEFLLEGLVAECIWPKNKMDEMGGHVQGSIKYFHLIDSVYHKEWGANSGAGCGPQPWNVAKIFPLLRIGSRLFGGHDVFALSSKLGSTMREDGDGNFTKCDEFPLMESRQLTWLWDRQLSGPRAFAFKSTISFVDETLTLWSKTHVVHEASLGEVEIVLDSAPLGRLVKLFSDPINQHNPWFDNRWLSGKWQEEIAKDVTAPAGIRLKDHLQPLPSLYPTGTKQSPLSSELRSITAHLDSITIRLPNPMEDISSFRMADVIFGISEATILVSSDLPSSFLAGGIAAENNVHEFPHDPSDISCDSTTAVSSERDTKFRMQISLTDCSLKLMPMRAHSLNKDALRFTNLLAPTKLTMMLSLSHTQNDETITPEMDATVAPASQSLIVSVLVHQLESNIELRSIYGAMETLNYHAGNIMKKDPTSGNVELSIPSVSVSADELITLRNSFSVVCIHVPESEIIIWGEQTPETSSPDTNQAQIKHNVLCRVKASQFEYGMEFMNLLLPAEKETDGAVHKCGIASASVEIRSQTGGSDGKSKMVEILSMGRIPSGSSHLIDKACALCSPDDKGERMPKRGFCLRSEKESFARNPSTISNAVEIDSPLVVDMDIQAIERFLNVVVECILAPVFVGSRSSGSHIGQTPLGSALWSTALQISTHFVSPQPKLVKMKGSDESCNSLLRLSLYQLLLQVPSESRDSFGFLFSDVEVAVGDLQSATTSHYKNFIEKHCGSRGQTWLKAFHLLDGSMANSDTFYALRLKHIALGMGCLQEGLDNSELKVIIPESSINWALPVPSGGSSNAPPFEIFAMKDLGLTFMYGAYPLSSLYFKLYKLSSQSVSAQTDFSLAVTRLHNLVGSYHCKMSNVIDQMNAEVDRLRMAVFSKETERVGALALASSTAAGWVRVGEDLSFSHRIFSSATFWRYWMVLDRSLLILYKSPGRTKPSFIIPLRATSDLRSLSMTSSSNKTSSGIVGRHVQQKGFAVFDSTEGTGLFFVTANDSEYRMWTQAISMVLKKEEAPAPGIASTENNREDNNMLQAAKPSMPSAKPPEEASTEPSVTNNVDQFGVVGDAPVVNPQATNPGVPINTNEKSGSGNDLVDVSEAPPPKAQDEISPDHAASSDELMDDVEMDEISLGDSEKVSNDSAPPGVGIPSTDSQLDCPATAAPPSQNQEHNPHSQLIPMRERLALAKGKSKMASSRFGSALKTAKGGVLAASEIGRDGIKQAMAKDTPRKEELTKRSLAVGQKMSMLKKNAGTKLTAARSAIQDQNHARIEDKAEPSGATALPTSSSRDELSGNPKLDVGQKMSLLKKNASTKLTSLGTTVRSSVQDQSRKSVITEGSNELPDMHIVSSSEDEISSSRPGKQELRKKLDQSMSSTMNSVRRLKIDEKMTQLSAAVKSGVKNDPMMRQLSNVHFPHSRNSDHPRQRLGIGEEDKSIKPINFNARETFGLSSELPLKVKSISCGDTLLIDDKLSEKMESLQKLEGSWIVSIDAIEIFDTQLFDSEIASYDASALPSSVDAQNKPSSKNQVRKEWKFRITTTNILAGSDTNTQSSVERTMAEVLLFHTTISEIVAKDLPSTAEVVSQEGFQHADSSNSIFKKLSPIERLRVSATTLQRVMEANCPPVRSSSFIKVYLSTLLECHLPNEALRAIEAFLNIDNLQSGDSIDHGTYFMNGTTSVNEAFGQLSDATLAKHPMSTQSNSLDLSSKSNQPNSPDSSLLDVIMDGYTKAMKERDEALASLATTSIINDNRIMQEQMAKSNGGSTSQVNINRGTKMNSSGEDDMLTLCKQLGNEIALRTAAESEINRLNERLQFERKIAQTKENELTLSLAQANIGTDPT